MSKRTKSIVGMIVKSKMKSVTGTLIVTLLIFVNAAQGQVSCQVSMEQNINREGSDYMNLETGGQPEECRQACAKDQNCRAYTWVPVGDRGLCWLKNAVPQPTAYNTWVSGVKQQNTLRPGEIMLPGDYLFSNNGQWKLEFRASDGNMVLYNIDKGDTDKGRVFGTDTGHSLPAYVPRINFTVYPLRHSASDGVYWHYAKMGYDGNFVMYQGLDLGGTMPLPLVFQTKTSENPGAFLRVEDDGNVKIIYDQNVLWHRGLTPW